MEEPIEIVDAKGNCRTIPHKPSLADLTFRTFKTPEDERLTLEEMTADMREREPRREE